MKREAHMHPKIRRLSVLIRSHAPNSIAEPQTIATGVLERLWFYASERHRFGILDGVDANLLAGEVGWNGDPQFLLDAIISTGWIDMVDGVLCVHDWQDHCPMWVTALLRSPNYRKKAGEYSLNLTPKLQAKVEAMLGAKLEAKLQAKPEATLDPRPKTLNPRTKTQDNNNTPLPPQGESAVADEPKPKPVRSKLSDFPEDFQKLWNAAAADSRSRSGLLDAFKAWNESGAAKEPERALRAVSAISQTRSWKEGFAPGLHRWLKGGGWMAEAEHSAMTLGERQIAANSGINTDYLEGSKP